MSTSVAVLSFVMAFPLGLAAALYRFPLRGLLMPVQALPLLLPSFLLAIGWSNLGASVWFPQFLLPSGPAGTALVLEMQAVPLAFFTTLAACRNLTASQIDAARLHGGEWTVLRLSGRACLAPALLSAMLAGVLSLSDAGAPLILGSRVAAVEILTSFSALYDTNLAARQCLTLTGVVVLCTLPLLIWGLPAVAAAVLARQTRSAVAYRHPWLGTACFLGLVAVFGIGLGLPTLGLCLPAVRNPTLDRAIQVVHRTLLDSSVYAGGAALLAVLLATALALAVGNRWRLRLVVLATLLSLFALPPAFAGLGVVEMATKAPPWLDWLTRGSAIVATVLGLRFLPVATLAMMRSVSSLAPSWSDAARLHGVSPSRFLARVALPIMKPAILVALILVTILATADITSVLLLQPPGRASLAVAIFTVMANSPEGLVASLCLTYVVGVFGIMAVAMLITRIWKCTP